jgi:hypothetical protein
VFGQPVRDQLGEFYGVAAGDRSAREKLASRIFAVLHKALWLQRAEALELKPS